MFDDEADDENQEDTDIEEVEDEEVVVAKKPAAKPTESKPVVVKVTSQPKKEEAKPVVQEAKPEVKETKPAPKAEPKYSQEDLEAKTVADLRELAKDLNLSGYSSLRKAELIELIQTAL
ncbi:MAG TPA: Rho termination factor N-terminal domain-containing protein [Bacillota bacterium]|nr:Rho termination factor N-terminal domain-containing protein [Bacillota bacterium]